MFFSFLLFCFALFCFIFYLLHVLCYCLLLTVHLKRSLFWALGESCRLVVVFVTDLCYVKSDKAGIYVLHVSCSGVCN